MKRYFIIACLFVLPAHLTAAEPPSFHKAMDALSHWVGEWTIEWYRMNEAGEWQKHATSPSSVKTSTGGAGLMESFSLPTETVTYYIDSIYSYDDFRKVYRMAAIDDQSGLLDVYEGQIKDGFLVLDNTRAKTFTLTEDGKSMAFRLRLQVDGKDEHVIFADISTDQGATWQDYTKGTYRRN